MLATAFLPPLGALMLLSTMHRSAPWLREQGAVGVAMFVVAFTFLGGMALLPTYAPSVLGGWAFGITTGIPAVLAGFLGAAALGFAVARRVSGDRLVAIIDEYPRGHAICRALLESGFGQTVLVVTLLRLPPNAPFAMTNLLLAATGVGWGPYLIGGALGLAPRVIAAVVVGAGLSRLDLAHLGRGGSVYLSISVSIVVVLALGWLANRALGRIGRAEPHP
jgi:uncharacterized membrane protein YdjX (TVP38/TMEM64 family)